MAETHGGRRECDRPQHYARRCAAHDRGRVAELAVLLDWTECRDLDDKTVRGSRTILRTNDARERFSARGRAIETGDDDRTGAGRVAASRAKLPRSVSGQDRQLIGHESQSAARGCDRKSAIGVRHFARRGGVRNADCVQQRRQSPARAIYRAPPGNRVAHGVGRLARERVATFHFRKFAREHSRGSNRCGIGVAVRAARAKNGGKFPSVQSRYWR